MPDVGDMPPQRRDQILSHSVHVIRIELHERIGRPAGVQDLDGLGRARQKEAGHVAGVDRFHQQRKPRLLKTARGITDVADECRAGIRSVHVLGNLASETVELTTAERRGVLDRQIDAGVELGHTIRMTCDAALARRPVARGQVMQHQRLSAVAKRVQDVGGGFGVGKLAFDGREPSAGRGVESFQKRTLREERTQVGGELQSALPAAVIVKAGTLRNISDRSGRMNENR
jgi:hypothetical protein